MIEQKDQYLYMAIFNYDLLYSLKKNNILDDPKYINSPILSDTECLNCFKKLGVCNQVSLISSLYSLFVLFKETIYTY